MPDDWKSNPRYAHLRPFNSQTATLAARRKHELQRQRAQEAANLPDPNGDDHSHDPRIALIEEQIALTRATLTKERMEPHHRAALLRSLCALLDQQRIARGEPLPGSRRPGPDKGKVNGRVWHEPVPVVPQAGPVPQVEPTGPEWSI